VTLGPSDAGDGAPPARPSRALGLGLVAVGLVLLALAVAALLLRHDSGPGGAASPALTPWTADGADPDAYAARLVTLTNDERASQGLAALAASDCATRQAATRAGDLAGGKALEHAPMEPVMAACGVSEAGENLARAAATPDDVVKAWLQSPGHRANLLDGTYRAVGIACRLDGGQMLCSQVFLGPTGGR
jgi:uncharacterized protein YkwD